VAPKKTGVSSYTIPFLSSRLSAFYLPFNLDLTLAGGELFLGASNEVPTNGGNLGAALPAGSCNCHRLAKLTLFCAGQERIARETCWWSRLDEVASMHGLLHVQASALITLLGL
jgi:hypothetical protein